MNVFALKIYFFLATSCPISQLYTSYINKLNTILPAKNVEITVVFPSADNNIKKDVKKFITKYGLVNSIIIDKNNLLTKKLGATTTPEVFILNMKEEVIYHGAIDNLYLELGRKRFSATENYIEQAINQYINGNVISISHVQPIGCYIENIKIKQKSK